MGYVQAIILSVVEGFTEFLPISSTGHLILASQILNVAQTDFAKTFEIAIQLGAITAVVFLYWRKVWDNKTLWKEIFVAFLPTAVIGFVLYKFVKHYLLGNSLVVVSSLIFGGIILIIFEKFIKTRSKKLTMKDYFLIGVAQSISIIPGISRAAATILGGEFLGQNKKEAVEFSFLLAIPTMVSAAGLDIIKSDFAFTNHEIILLLIGTIGSFIVAAITIRFFVKFIQNHNFVGFGVYRIIVGLFFLILVKYP
jgi:undecaprenyl-diphosphatase